MNAWPCEKGAQRSHAEICLAGFFWGHDRDLQKQSSTGWMCVKPLALLTHQWTRILQHLPRQKGSLLKFPFSLPACHFPSSFPDTPRTWWDFWGNARHGKLQEEQRWEPVPSEWGWGIYSPSNARTLFLSVVVVTVRPREPSALCQLESSDTGGECFPVPCLLLLFWVSHLWARGTFRLPRRVYRCHEFKCCGCSEQGVCSGGWGRRCVWLPSALEGGINQSQPTLQPVRSCSLLTSGQGEGVRQPLAARLYRPKTIRISALLINKCI